MHSAIFVVEKLPHPQGDVAWMAYLSSARIVEGNEGVRCLAESVWQIDFKVNPCALATLIYVTERQHKLPYRLLQLADEPQWIEIKPPTDEHTP